MKIILAPDKFKGSLTGLEFCNIVEMSLKKNQPNIDVLKLPLADGGDGTIEVVNYYLKGKIITITVNNPFFQPVKASYLYAKATKTAFIEMAEASGVKLLQIDQLNCKEATTFGTGEMIVDAIKKGATNIILGIGGSATNDCGIGMASALGYRFLDKSQKEVKPIGANLSKIVFIDTTKIHPNLSKVAFKIACDVTNPLYGKNGAAFVYAAQKGASKEDIQMLDKGMQDFSKVIQTIFNIDVQKISGSGAAGGLGMASKVFLNGNLEPGIQLIKKLANFDEQINDADWIITGEGKLDAQTLSGKTIQGVLNSAKTNNIKVAAFCGKIALNETVLKEMGIQYAKDILSRAINFKDALKNTQQYLTEISNQFFKEVAQ